MLSGPEDRVGRARDFIGMGLADYVGARVLLLSGLPQQGAILSSAAIEKYFKAILALRGNLSHGHLKKAHWQSIQNYQPDLFRMVRTDFLELNRLAYQLRYTDDLEVGFNQAIATREFLAELDHTALAVQRMLVFKQDGQPMQGWFDLLLEQKDRRLFAENHILLGQAKEEFVYSERQLVYEVRMLESRRLLESTYVSDVRPSDPSFVRPAWVPVNTEKQIYRMSHLPPQ